MIRLLWLFLILDVLLVVILLIGDFVTYGASLDRSETLLRLIIELAALAIIEAVRERKS